MNAAHLFGDGLGLFMAAVTAMIAGKIVLQNRDREKQEAIERQRQQARTVLGIREPKNVEPTGRLDARTLEHFDDTGIDAQTVELACLAFYAARWPNGPGVRVNLEELIADTRPWMRAALSAIVHADSPTITASPHE